MALALGGFLVDTHTLRSDKMELERQEFMAHMACRVCRIEPKLRDEIDKALLKGEKFREIAKDYKDYLDCDLHLLEQSLSTHLKKKHIARTHELTAEEEDFLDRFKRGEVSFEEASAILAVKVFEKILKNPDEVKYSDFIRMELLKIKLQKMNSRESFAINLTNRLFNGKLPPRICPNCGAEQYKMDLPEPKVMLNGDILDS